MTLAARLLELDRRAGLGRQPTAEQWRGAARRWRWLVVVACCQVACIVVAVALRTPAGAVTALLGFVAVGLAFQAGRWKAEDDRLTGRDGIMAGQRRPSGL